MRSSRTGATQSAPDDRTRPIDSIVPYERMSLDAYRWMSAPLLAYFSPKCYGFEHVDRDRPTLLVANHTIYGLIDTAVLGAELILRKGIYMRGLADRVHFMLPWWGSFLSRAGAVLGTPENCAQLMAAGEHLLVFPGGGREVARRKGEAYKLMWKNRTGFVRMAVEHGYSITPVAQVGVENAYDILVDAAEIMASPLGTFLKRTGIADTFLRGGDAIMPLARGLGPTLLPRPERLYFSFAEPIETSGYAGKQDDQTAMLELRSRVADAVNGEIGRMLRIREQDTDRGWLRRLLTRLG